MSQGSAKGSIISTSGAALPFTFQPGGTAHDNVFVTEGSLNAAVNASFGPQTVYLDFSNVSGNYTTSSNLNLGSYIIGMINNTGGQESFLTTAHQINTPLEITNTLIRMTQSDGYTLTSSPILLKLSGYTGVQRASGDGYLFNATDVVNGHQIDLRDSASLGDGTNPVIHVSSGVTLTINMYDNSILIANSLNIDAGGAVTIEVNSATANCGYTSGGGVTVDLNFPKTVVDFESSSAPENLVSLRTGTQSAIDPTKNGIVNLSSDTTQAAVGATGNFSTISGGDQNEASGDYSTVSGGDQNIASNYASVISGGERHTASNQYCSVIGGYNCTASGQYSIVGGDHNTASGNSSISSSGQDNIASGDYSCVIGGYTNIASGDYSAVVGGDHNTASANYSVCIGEFGQASGPNCIVLGYNSTAQGDFCSMALGIKSWASRVGQLAFSSSGSNISLGSTIANAQNGNMVYSRQQPAIGSPFILTDYEANEFDLQGANSARYYSLNIRILAMADNANVGPATWVYEVLAHVAGGVAIIDAQSTVLTSDPHTTGWLTSITVNGTSSILSINIDPNGDVTNVINATADIKWVEIQGFNQ